MSRLGYIEDKALIEEYASIYELQLSDLPIHYIHDSFLLHFTVSLIFNISIFSKREEYRNVIITYYSAITITSIKNISNIEIGFCFMNNILSYQQIVTIKQICNMII